MTRLRVLLLILYVLLIFFLSSRPYLTPLGPDFRLKDKAVHAVEYFVLGVLLYTGIGWLLKRSKFTIFWILFAIGTTLAAMDEILQSFIPGRLTDVYDWTADSIGVVVGVALAIVVSDRWARAHKRSGGDAA